MQKDSNSGMVAVAEYKGTLISFFMAIGRPSCRGGFGRLVDGLAAPKSGPIWGCAARVVDSDDEGVGEEGISPSGVGSSTNQAVEQVVDDEPSYRDDMEMSRLVAFRILDKLKLAGCGSHQSLYPEDFKLNVCSRLQGKAYLGQRSLYVFGQEDVSIFEMGSLRLAFSGLQLSDEERDFIVGRCFGHTVKLESIPSLLRTESGAMSALIGVVNSLYGSSIAELNAYFGSGAVIERELEKTFESPEERVAY